jgi:Na+/H+ antiporter NhaC
MSPLEFAPWAFFNYLNPLLSIGLAYLGFGIFKKTVNAPLAQNS